MIRVPCDSDLVNLLMERARSLGPFRTIEISWIDLPGQALIEFRWDDD
jgi:hypothetical protein